MEILYQIDCTAGLIKPEYPVSAEIRPIIACPEDYNRWLAMFRDRNPNYDIPLADWCNWMWESEDCVYYGAFVSGRMVSVASIEKYNPDRWETAAVRTLIAERGRGYGKLLCYEVTKSILESGKIATARTEEDNIPMQRVLAALGFAEV